MFHNLKSTAETLMTVSMLMVALIACEKVPESNPNFNNNSPILNQSQSRVILLQQK